MFQSRELNGEATLGPSSWSWPCQTAPTAPLLPDQYSMHHTSSICLQTSRPQVPLEIPHLCKIESVQIKASCFTWEERSSASTARKKKNSNVWKTLQKICHGWKSRQSTELILKLIYNQLLAESSWKYTRRVEPTCSVFVDVMRKYGVIIMPWALKLPRGMMQSKPAETELSAVYALSTVQHWKDKQLDLCAHFTDFFSAGGPVVLAIPVGLLEKEPLVSTSISLSTGPTHWTTLARKSNAQAGLTGSINTAKHQCACEETSKHLKMTRGARVAPGNRSMPDTTRTLTSTRVIGASGHVGACSGFDSKDQGISCTEEGKLSWILLRFETSFTEILST